MKTGTFLCLDKNFKNVAVGDTIRDKDGNTYRIDQYGMALTPDDGKGFKKRHLNDLMPFEVVPKPAPELKPVDPEDDPLLPEVSPEVDRQKLMRDALEILTDADLAAELRKRGYEVKATKTTIIEL